MSQSCAIEGRAAMLICECGAAARKFCTATPSASLGADYFPAAQWACAERKPRDYAPGFRKLQIGGVRSGEMPQRR